MGMTPPSAMPMMNRAANSMANEPARPESSVAPENKKADATSRALRRPNASDSRPTNRPSMDQLNDSADANVPIEVFDRPSSGWMKGMSTLMEFRSKNTMPKFRLS